MSKRRDVTYTPSLRSSTAIQLVGAKLLLLVGFAQTLVIIPKLIFTLGGETYGYWVAISGLIGLLAFLDLGATGLASQRGAHFIGKKDYESFLCFVNTIAIWDFLASFAIILTGIILYNFLPMWLGVPTTLVPVFSSAIILGVLEVLLSLWSSMTGSLLFAMQRPLIHMLGTLIGLIVSLAVIWYLLDHGWGLISIPIGGMVRSFIPFMMNSLTLFRILLSFKLPLLKKPSREMFGDFCRKSSILAPAQLLESLLGQLDSLVALKLFGPQVVTYLDISRKAATFSVPLITRIPASFIPGLSHLYGAARELRFAEISSRLFLACIYLSTITFFGLVIFNEGIVSVWTSPEMFIGQYATICLAGIAALKINKACIYTLARARGEVVITATSSFVEFPLHIFLILTFGFVFGIEGMTFGAFVAAGVGLYVQFYALRRTSLNITHCINYNLYKMLLTITLISLVFSLVVSRVTPSWASIAIGAVIYGGIQLAALWILEPRFGTKQMSALIKG